MEFHIRKKWIGFDKELKLSLKDQCRLLKVSRSSIYYKPQVKIKIDEQILEDEIIKIYQEIPYYGYIRTYLELKARGFSTSVKEVRKIRQELGLLTIIPEKKCNYKKNRNKKYPYLLKHLAVNRPNQVWVSDITYIKLRRGMLYKVAIMDVFSRKILGYRVSNSLNKTFCVELLENTIAQYGVPEIFNTDQGSQFTSDEFINLLKNHGIKISMDSKGRALDNIFIERYWKSYKYESVFLHNYFSVFDAKLKTAQYVTFYNSRRFHSSLNYSTPDEIYFNNLPKEVQEFKQPLKNMS